MSKPLVAYYRVSTREQGRSGLGIDAQRAAVTRFAEAEGFEVDVEHGAGRQNPLEHRSQSPSKRPTALQRTQRLATALHVTRDQKSA
jgi:hypothetical protein